MFKEAATKITKFIASATAPIIESDESIWIYGILFVNSDPSFPAVLIMSKAGAETFRTVAISPSSSYEFEVPYLDSVGLRIALFAGGPVTVYVFHSSGGF